MKREADQRDDRRPAGWSDWYRFARRTLEYGHTEAAAYANVRTVEDLNRARRSGRQAA